MGASSLRAGVCGSGAAREDTRVRIRPGRAVENDVEVAVRGAVERTRLQILCRCL